MQTSINWYLTAATLRAAFEQDVRDDGSKYWRLTAEAKQSVDDLTFFLHELHGDELPNDWRYETIINILDAIIEDNGNTYRGDLAFGIADNLTDTYNSDLLKWYADCLNRLKYPEIARDQGLIRDGLNVIAQLTIGQSECIRTMADLILDKINYGANNEN